MWTALRNCEVAQSRWMEDSELVLANLAEGNFQLRHEVSRAEKLIV